jgi:hypothetical protein
LRYFDLRGKTLLAYREYVGKEWFKFLIERDLNFVIRLRQGHYEQAINAAEGKSYQALVNKVKRSKVEGKALKKAFILEEE